MLGGDYSSQLLGVSWTFTSLSAFFVAGRFFCRWYCDYKIGWDDFWAAVSLVMGFAMSISWTVYAKLGGTLNAPLTYDQSKSTVFVSWLSQIWCIIGITTSKIAVAALIMRLQGSSRWRTRVLWFLCSVCAAWSIMQIGLIWGQCHPTATLWDPQGNPNGKCWSPKVVVYNGIACSSFWAFTDVSLAVIPVHIVLKLHIPMRRKIGICLLLSTGIFAAAITIVRITYLRADLQKNSNIVHQFVLFFIWTSLEINALIIGSCVPNMVPLWELARGRGAPRSRNKASKGQSSYDSKKIGSVNQRKAKNQDLDSQINLNQVYINNDANEHGTSFNGESENTFGVSVSTQDGTSQSGHGIYVTREVDVTNSKGRRN